MTNRPAALSRVLMLLALVACAIATLACTDKPPGSAVDDSWVPDGAETVVRALRGGGVRVELFDYATGEPHFAPAPFRRLRINGYNKVILYQFDDVPSAEMLFESFGLGADFAVDNYPVLFAVDKTVILVRGAGSEAAQAVYTALWSLRPPHQIAPSGGPLVGPSALHRCQAVEAALVHLHWYSDMRPRCDGTATSNVTLVRFDDYLRRFGIDETRFRRLPHRDTVVWAVMDHPSENGELGDRWDVVLVDWYSGIVIGVDSDVSQSRFNELPPLSTPGPLILEAQDGHLSSYDELATVLLWNIPRPADWLGTGLTEDISAFVIERARSAELDAGDRPDAWQTLSVVRADGWLISRGRPTPLRQIELSSNQITYRDWEVVEGEQYAYRIHGCTRYGRQTTYSSVAEAIAGDPDRSTFVAFALPSGTTLRGCPGPD